MERRLLMIEEELASRIFQQYGLNIETEHESALNSFINLAFFQPEGHIFTDEKNALEFQQYKFETTKLFSSILKQPDRIDLLLGYFISTLSRFLVRESKRKYRTTWTIYKIKIIYK